MARHAPPLVLISMSILIWVLWKQEVYPFTEHVFTYDAYGMHVVGGIGYTALQVWGAYFFPPDKQLRSTFWIGHVLIATGILMIIEILQLLDHTRNFQAEDILAQTIGVLIAVYILQQFHRKRMDSE